MCILLLFGGLFYKTQLKLADWVIQTFYILLIFFLFVLQFLWEEYLNFKIKLYTNLFLLVLIYSSSSLHPLYGQARIEICNNLNAYLWEVFLILSVKHFQ